MALDADERIINEKTTATYTAYLVDELGEVVALTDIVTLTLSYYNKTDGSTINSRTSQNVLNANNVTLHATSGLLTWLIQTTDTVIVDTSLAFNALEEHPFLFTWTTATKTGRHPDYVLIRNLRTVT